MNIKINFIPEKEMRYPSFGDWFYDDNGDLVIAVANDIPELNTRDHQFLVALHELVEVWLCQKDGITQKMVDDFDMGEIADQIPEDEEPGDHPAAPYREQHRKAMIIEHLMANFLGLKGYGVIR